MLQDCHVNSTPERTPDTYFGLHPPQAARNSPQLNALILLSFCGGGNATPVEPSLPLRYCFPYNIALHRIQLHDPSVVAQCNLSTLFARTTPMMVTFPMDTVHFTCIFNIAIPAGRDCADERAASIQSPLSVGLRNTTILIVPDDRPNVSFAPV